MNIIIDYGIGNVFSVQRSIEHCGVQNVKLSSDPDEIYNSDRLILPGVGAFKDGMDELKIRNLVEPIKESITKGTPLLGICLGMQMLATSSTENGFHDGLNFISGKVESIIDKRVVNENNIKVPYIGWANISVKHNNENILSSIDSDKKYLYLVHSYHVKTLHNQHTIGVYSYGGVEITAAIQNENIIGFQFHPEKSGEIGIEILNRFLQL